jgi:hypothetical protein
LPDALKEQTELLVKKYDFFTGVLHGDGTDEVEFDQNWSLFQDFFIMIVSSIFENIEEIDQFLAIEGI